MNSKNDIWAQRLVLAAMVLVVIFSVAKCSQELGSHVSVRWDFETQKELVDE